MKGGDQIAPIDSNGFNLLHELGSECRSMLLEVLSNRRGLPRLILAAAETFLSPFSLAHPLG